MSYTLHIQIIKILLRDASIIMNRCIYYNILFINLDVTYVTLYQTLMNINNLCGYTFLFLRVTSCNLM